MAHRLRAGDAGPRRPRPPRGLAPGVRHERSRARRRGVFMKLRTRLVLAFFALSVVPLGAVTYYSYTNNVRALREAAERETDLLAGELGQRMQLVTAQLSQRVEHLMDIAELQAAADEAKQLAQARPAAAEPALTKPAVMADSLLGDSIAKSLGEAAMLLNNVELQNMQGGRGGGPPRAPRPPLTVVTRTNPTVDRKSVV